MESALQSWVKHDTYGLHNQLRNGDLPPSGSPLLSQNVFFNQVNIEIPVVLPNRFAHNGQLCVYTCRNVYMYTTSESLTPNL